MSGCMLRLFYVLKRNVELGDKKKKMLQSTKMSF